MVASYFQRTRVISLWLGGVCCWLSCATVGQSAEPLAGMEFFEKRIRPVLVEHCYECHASTAKKVHAGLLLDSRAGSRAGGDSGPSVVPGDPDESLLLSALRYDAFEMPPSGPLPAHVIADFEHWIQSGAVDPREGEIRRPEEVDLEAGKQFWAFRPLAPAPLPQVQESSWPRATIDYFILSRLERHGLQPVPSAPRREWIRRASYALVGLPPRPEEVDAFCRDEGPDAYAKVIDRLLASEHFGERWGRHWLDVVRYAESSGGGRTLLFPDAYRYRDYVIDAFNRDLPYDDFVREQVAGDLLQADDWQTRQRQLIATAFLVLGPTNYELQDKDALEMDIVDEQLDTLGKAVMGMTLGCARCHDHKFDPIPMTDYYALAGILKSTKSVIHSNVSTWNKVALPLPAEREAQLDKHEQRLSKKRKALKQLTEKLKGKGRTATSRAVDPATLAGIVVDDEQAERVGRWVRSTSVPGFVGAGYQHDDQQRDPSREITFRAQLPTAGDYEIRLAYTPGGNRSSRVPVVIQHAKGTTTRYVNQKRPGEVGGTFTSLGTFSCREEAAVRVSNRGAGEGVVIADAVVFLRPGEAAKKKPVQPAVDPDASLVQQQKQLQREVKELEGSGLTRPQAMAVADAQEVGDIHLAIRGVVHNQGPLVPRGTLQVAQWTAPTPMPSHESGRLELAAWLTDARHPLTARVFVNRVWYWLFGQGLVRSVDNFGAMGEMPSHPQLLDHLAEEFVRDGWSVKRLIRRLMLSRVYQLSAAPGAQPGELDPDNRLWWRMNRQRLDAEALRDTLLVISGGLDARVGGSNIKPGTKSEYGYEFDSLRRSVYLPVFRNTLPDVFANFDFADPNVQGGKRTTSTIAPQALWLMNAPFVIEQSRQAAARFLAQADVDDRIDRVYRVVLGRPPYPAERDLLEEFLADHDNHAVWSLVIQMLFQSVDFRYVP